MLVLKLVYNRELNFLREIHELRTILKKKDIIIGIVESMEQDNHIIKLLCDDEVYTEKVRESINLYMSNVLYKIVVSEYRKREMFDFIRENYFFLKQEEIIEVENNIIDILLLEENINSENFIFCMNKMNSIIEKIKIVLEENSEINIDGFIRFRMKELREDVDSIVNNIIESYMVEKEYQEFVKLLKYFVDIQDSKIEEVNIIINESGNYIIKDKHGEDIFIEFVKELTENKIDLDTKMEDIIISGLITNSPKILKIHGKEYCNNKEFLETIGKVFENKVIYCEKCEFCKKKEIKL